MPREVQSKACLSSDSCRKRQDRRPDQHICWQVYSAIRRGCYGNCSQVPRFEETVLGAKSWLACTCRTRGASRQTRSLRGNNLTKNFSRWLTRFTKNLGHPPVSDLVRILKHAHGIRESCTVSPQTCLCILPSPNSSACATASKDVATDGVQSVSWIDVKFLHGWQPNQKIKALNLVDQASCYQLVIPFHERETSKVINV